MGSWKDFIFGIPFEEQKRRLESNPSSVSPEEYRRRMEELDHHIWAKAHPHEASLERLRDKHAWERTKTERAEQLSPRYYALTDAERTAVHWQALRQHNSLLSDIDYVSPSTGDLINSMVSDREGINQAVENYNKESGISGNSR